MKLLLNHLNINVETKLIINTIPTLISCLVKNVPNLRKFELLKGPEMICKLLKYKPTGSNEINDWKLVQVKIIEFLFFYLVPESSHDKKERVVYKDGCERYNMEQKVNILKEYLNNNVIEGLVNELKESKPFGSMNNEW
ncbi:hypothetical protein CANARDRAFT_30742 [[Candida] arabinofermentans NRRL YB-2248]|uniref:Uncharacterized protein n=1 Tax=[Candida] arabinofermentans NRRL YB-2248 TaxID=983967 RepID=A0A1E4SSQ5_9ASCO|nr:hypothetical protein CANARDRAFT_30742 [[Candida] arabinofermentans NRRL YB-2248]